MAVVALVVTLMVSNVMVVFATDRSIEDRHQWFDFINDSIAHAGRPASNEALAHRLSSLSGRQTVQTGGVNYPFLIVYPGSVQDNGNALNDITGRPSINGSFTTLPAGLTTTTTDGRSQPNLADYQGYIVALPENPTGANNAIAATVFVHKEATASHHQRVQANISSALLSSAGVQPDTGSALTLMTGMMGFVNTALGIIVVVMSIGMTIFSALDITYIAFPVFQNKVDSQVESGGKNTRKNKEGETSSRWVSDDARNAVKEANANNAQPWMPYFKRRVLAYIFLSIMLFILLTGNIFAITSMVTGVLSGLFEALGLG
jgi:hypothetical protein